VRLRTQIFLFLFLFGFAPLISAVVINLPLVLERLELFYHKAHLQNLRADFRDLDQHIASRQEMVRLLAKLPEPGAILGTGDDADGADVDRARARYTEWVNQIFQEQLDITQILFVDDRGRERFWLERNPETQIWEPTVSEPMVPSGGFLEAALKLDRGGVLISPIDVDAKAGASDPRRLLSMYLASPIGPGADGPMGAVIMTIDVGGLARFYRDTLWVRADGRYLGQQGMLRSEGNAFEDFQGLEEMFQTKTLSLWRQGPWQVIWVPMFRTEQGEPIWVGRRVDPSPLADFRTALIVRVLAIVLIVILVIWIAARWFSLRAERVGRELGEGIARVLEHDEPARFDWRRPEELRRLGANLSRLAEKHVRNTRNLRAHARELEAAYRYKSEFLSNVSHELRTPLNSILLLSKMLSESSSLSPEQAHQATVIHRAGSDLRTLIDNILDLSRIEAGRAVINLETVALPALLEEVIELVRPQFEARTLSLDLTVDPDAPATIVSDPDKIRQILKNFLSNAVKFTERGGVEVALARAGDDASPRPVRISVRDTGIGIPADKQEVIFEAFKQADGSTSRRYGGTGLGLTISLQLAELLGGTIELNSLEGQGAVFSLLLPLSHVPGPAERRRAGRERPHEPVEEQALAPPDADFSGHCVLVVDEDVQTMLTLTPILERWGLRVTAAGDTAEALEALHDEPDCSLVLLDIQMPELDACATITELKNKAESERTPVIALMTDTSDKALEACRKAGADDLVAKPVDATVLKEKLAAYLAPGAPADMR
jgi:signal transduction histidine kinase/CheY-like chemotaxis protein